jgi:hypothetical protein
MIPILAVTAFAVGAVVTPPPLPTVSEVLSGMAKQTMGLETYDVPVTIHASVRASIVSIPVTLTGMRYFAVPDKEALKLNSVPSIAKVFSNLYASLGTPVTWPQTYNLQVVQPDHVAASPIYELRGTYKHASRVDHILLDVDATTYDPVEARWFYRNGATIVMTVQEESVGEFRLPAVENVDVHFPGYSGNATIDYGTYSVNATVPDSVFNQQ